jgi:putative ABC transport system ATP-binding protein
MLKMEAVSKLFVSGRDRVTALSDLHLEMERGEFLTVIGSNGAGKTTLLNVISGTTSPTAGKVWIAGREVTSVPAHRRARWIARIVQDPLQGTSPNLSIAENLALATKRSHRGLRPALPRALRRRLVGLLREHAMGLERRMDDPVCLLSGGERQALAVTMATLAHPHLLLLDEHTAALDPHNARRISLLTRAFVEELELTTVMVTHNMEQAIEMGSRLVMMHKGAFVVELEGEEKQRATVADLVELFSRRHIAEDELLLTRAA